jgi:hypothetical protein
MAKAGEPSAMTAVLWLLLIQGIMGAFDTLYYHEWKARLPAMGLQAKSELRLHALRDFIYIVMFGSLPWVMWSGYLVIGLAILLVAEIGITLADFVVEDTVRKPLGGVYPGERVTHAIMGIIYGAMLANLIPVLISWYHSSTGFSAFPQGVVPEPLRWAMAFMTAGLLASGLRDLAASFELPHSCWPWRREHA